MWDVGRPFRVREASCLLGTVKQEDIGEGPEVGLVLVLLDT